VGRFLEITDLGSSFLFGNLVQKKYFFPGSDYWPGFGFQFAFSVLPTIIFFSAIMSILYYMGVMQVIVQVMARFMRWTMGTSGAETLSCSANIFIGQTEAPLLIKPFLDDMTLSELHAIMVGGFATIAGGVMAAYVRFGVDAGHLMAASVMSAPAALVMAKIIFPETEKSQTADGNLLNIEKKTANIVDAAASGAADGLRLAVNVGAMLMAFIALIALLNYGLGLIGGLFGYSGLSLRTIFGILFYPLSFFMGVEWSDLLQFGNLLGTKISINEMVAYVELTNLKDVISPRSYIIATYALCGFANFSSIAIQIGGISSIAPNRRQDLARLGIRAMFAGALASWLTATIAGMLI
jgi:CNT family concentrative nucleoside transporter